MTALYVLKKENGSVNKIFPSLAWRIVYADAGGLTGMPTFSTCVRGAGGHD